MRLRTVIVLAAGLMVTSAQRADEGSPPIRSYGLGRHGDLQLAVPQSWSEKVSQTYVNAPPTIYFSSDHDPTFTLKVHPGWSDTGNPDFTDPEYVRATVQKWATGGQWESAAPTLPLLEITGADAHGWLYRFLDKSHARKALRYWTIGLVITGDLVVRAEVHASGPESSAEHETIELLKSARQSKPARIGPTSVAQAPSEDVEKEPANGTRLRLPVWGIELTIPGYRTCDDYPSSEYGPNFLFAAQSSGTCELNMSMFAEECEEGATPEQCVRGRRPYAGNPETLGHMKNIRGLEHQSAPLTYTRFDQVFDDPRDPATGAFVKSHGPAIQNQLYGYWTRGHYCFELHISAIACASFTEQAMPIVRSVAIGPDTGATHETILMGRLTDAPHNSYRVHAAVAKDYTDRKLWASAVPFYRSALALGGDSIPNTDRIDLKVGLGDALIRPDDSRAEGISLLEQALQSAQEIGDVARVRNVLFPLSWGLALTGDTDNACARARALLEPLERKDREDYVREIRDSWPCHALHRAECYKALLPTLDLKWKAGPWKPHS